MKRELKFKSYWKDSSSGMVASDVMEIRVGVSSYSAGSQYSNYRNLVGFCQYTGLKDKNGKEIYEGDILHSEKGHTGSVVWIDTVASFAVCCTDGKWALNEGDLNREPVLTYTSIIGNIYENSDLLK